MKSTMRRYEQQSTFVNPFSMPAKPPRAAQKRAVNLRAVSLRVDVPLLLAVITLMIFGLIMVYSASYDYSLQWYGDPNQILSRQIMWMVLGGLGAAFLAWMDYHIFQRLAVPLMAVTGIMLVGVLLVNEIRNNAVRTLLGGSIQPSELAKIVTIIYLSVWLYSKRDLLKNWAFGLAPLAMILGGIGGLIFIQPDLSAVITICILGGVLFFIAGGDLKQILFVAVIAAVVGYGIVQFNSTGSQRLEDYMAGANDLTGASYHIRRALEAFLKGGWFGVGIGNANTKLTGLPVPPTDSIFAVVGEETGVVGAGGLLALYLVLLWRGLTIARRAQDDLGAYMAAGLSLWLAFEAFINMAVMVNLLPFAGNALPFISAGGSNLVVSLAAVGILLNISRRSAETREESGRLFSAVVDLRRWDRRRSVSGSGRSGRPQKTV